MSYNGVILSTDKHPKKHKKKWKNDLNMEYMPQSYHFLLEVRHLVQHSSGIAVTHKVNWSSVNVRQFRGNHAEDYYQNSYKTTNPMRKHLFVLCNSWDYNIELH